MCFTMVGFLGISFFLIEFWIFVCIGMMNLQEVTVDVKMEDQCIENKQSTAASCSSVSEGSANSFLKSPAIASPATVSSTHRYFGLIRLLSPLFIESK